MSNFDDFIIRMREVVYPKEMDKQIKKNQKEKEDILHEKEKQEKD